MLLDTISAVTDTLQVVNEAVGTILTENRSLDLEKRILKAIIDYFLVAVFIGGLGYGIYRVMFKGDEISDLFTKNPRRLFEFLTFGSTILEVISLSLIAIDRGVPMSTGMIRYGLVGIVEIASAFQFSRYVAIIFIDRKVNKKDTGAIYGSIFWFVISFFCTWFIWWLYTENAGANIFMIDGLNVLLDRQDVVTKQGELGAWFTVWVTVAFNILNAVFQYQKMSADNLEEDAKREAKKDREKDREKDLDLDINERINQKEEKEKKKEKDKLLADIDKDLESIKEKIKVEKDPVKREDLYKAKSNLEKKRKQIEEKK